jgi:hypothetical protein
VHGVADGAPGKLMGNQVFTHQLLVQRFGNVIFNHQRMPGAQTVTRQTHHPLSLQCPPASDRYRPPMHWFHFPAEFAAAADRGHNGKVVFGFTFTGKFHGLNYAMNMGREW